MDWITFAYKFCNKGRPLDRLDSPISSNPDSMGPDGQMAQFIMASSNEPYINRVLTLNDYN
jgi:hypothetical protein